MPVAASGVDGRRCSFGITTNSTAVAYRLFIIGLPEIRPTQAAVFVLLEQLVATGLARLLLGERLTLLGWAGAGLPMVAVLSVTAPGSDGAQASAAQP